MTPRAQAGRRKVCNAADAKARLADAKAFLDVAEVADNADVKATNAIHAAIAAADAICCVELRERSSDGDHSSAVRLLGRVDPQLANALDRCLRRKTQASYDSRDVSDLDAAACASRARTLLDAAQQRVAST